MLSPGTDRPLPATGGLPPAADPLLQMVNRPVREKYRLLFGFVDLNPCVWQTDSINRGELRGAASDLFALLGEVRNGSRTIKIDGEDGNPAIFVSMPRTDAVPCAEAGGASRVFDDIAEWRTRAQLNDQLAAARILPMLPLPMFVKR